MYRLLHIDGVSPSKTFPVSDTKCFSILLSSDGYFRLVIWFESQVFDTCTEELQRANKIDLVSVWASFVQVTDNLGKLHTCESKSTKAREECEDFSLVHVPQDTGVVALRR